MVFSSILFLIFQKKIKKKFNLNLKKSFYESFQNIFILNDFWGNNITKKDSHKSYRPLTTLSFLFERHMNDGLDSRSMKLMNLIIHIVNCCLLLNFLQAILNSRKTAFIATVLFCVHPIHTEAVCGVVSRSDLMACLVFLLSGIFYFNVFYKGELGVACLLEHILSNFYLVFRLYC